MKITIIFLLSMFALNQLNNIKTPTCVEKNKMEVCWVVHSKTIEFTLKAPTNGWVGIGFNENTGLAGTYLLLARVKNGEPEVVEHFTHAPGNYASIKSLGAIPVVSVISGKETSASTEISFSIPTTPTHKYGKPLGAGATYNMLIAYSREDDFNHHSMMRTNVSVKL